MQITGSSRRWLSMNALSGDATPSLWILGLLVAACCLFGGSARADAPSLILLRPILVLLLGGLLLQQRAVHAALRSTPFWLLVALGGAIVIGLLPLPPGIWSALPGRAPYTQSLTLHGWRYYSLSPDRTWNSLLALLPALIGVISTTHIMPRYARLIPLIILCAALSSAALGVMQIVSGKDSIFYLYETSHAGLATGWFSNRNHEAALLAIALPMSATWAAQQSSTMKRANLRLGLGVGLVLFLMVSIFVTGSRSGLILMLFSLVFAAVILMPQLLERVPARFRLAVAVAVVGAGLVFVAVIFFLGRALSVERFLHLEIGADERLKNIPAVGKIIEATFPAGTGFGSFDPVFRGYEPVANLNYGYFNNAHNDLLELTMTGGIVAILVLFGFFLWLIREIVFAYFKSEPDPYAEIKLSSFAGIVILLAASLTDYPLRTPLFGLLFGSFCAVISFRWINLRDHSVSYGLASKAGSV